MTLFQTQFDRDLGDSVSGLLTCRHLLFEEEKDYVICPACGELLTKKLPQDSQDKARLYLVYKKLKKRWLSRTGLISSLTVVGVALMLPDLLARLVLDWGNYGFKQFILSSPKMNLVVGTTSFAYIPLFIAFLGNEHFKRSNFFSLSFKSFYKLWYWWPVRIFAYIVIVSLVSYYAWPWFRESGMGYMAKHDYLTIAQRDKGVELFVWVNMFSVWIVAITLLVFEFLNNLKTRLIKQANEAYLVGRLETH